VKLKKCKSIKNTDHNTEQYTTDQNNKQYTADHNTKQYTADRNTKQYTADHNTKHIHYAVFPEMPLVAQNVMAIKHVTL
jgi:hypothetical protein